MPGAHAGSQHTPRSGVRAEDERVSRDERYMSLAMGLGRFLRSRGLPVVLLVVILLGAALGTIVPQEVDIPAAQFAAWKAGHPLFVSACELMGFTHVHRSWWFIAAASLLAASICWCTVARLVRSPRPVARKAGSALFHLSLILLMAGALVSKSTRIAGELTITEGQTVEGPLKGWDRRGRKVRFWRDEAAHRVTLESFTAVRNKDQVATRYESVLVVDGPDGRRADTVLVNHPLVHDGVAFLLHRYGPAPRFTVKNRDAAPGSEPILRSYVNLRLVGEGREDSFPVPGTEMTVHVRFNQDFVVPVFEVEARDGQGEHLARGETGVPGIVRGPGLEIEVDDLRYWNMFLVRRERGKAVVYAGFWTAVAGLVMGFLPLATRRLGG